MKIGYARVSTKDQSLDLQIDALKQAGCKKIFQEKKSGKNIERSELNSMMGQLREGDIVVVYKLDRLGRSMKDLVSLISTMEKKKVSFTSLQDNIDTTSATGKLVFHIFSSLAEFERDLISERTKAGLESARARGRKGGRPKGLSKEAEKTANAAVTLYRSKNFSIKEMCEQLGISKPTFYSYLRFKKIVI